MPVDPDALAEELRWLSRGLGARRPDLLRRLGPQIKLLSGITDDDGPAAARRRLMETLDRLLRGEPKTRLAITAALALYPEADQRFLGDRERWLGERLSFHERTARRRVSEAIEIVVRLATEDDQDRETSDAWQVQAIRALFRLDGATPELTEQRTVLMTKDNVGEIVTRFSLPRGTALEEPNELATEIVYGGQIRASERLSLEHFRYDIELPRRYHRGETHEYGIRFRIPPGQPMAPHYALVPLLTVKSLDLTVRFDSSRPPARVWRLDGVAPRMIDNPPTSGSEILRVDRVGEIRTSFRNLRQGFGYGARWQPPGESG